MTVAADKCFNVYIIDFFKNKNFYKHLQQKTGKQQKRKKFYKKNPQVSIESMDIFLTQQLWTFDDYFLATSSRSVEVILSRLFEYRALRSILCPLPTWRGGAGERESKNSPAAGWYLRGCMDS